MSGLKQTLSGSIRARERSALVSKEFALKESFGERCAIDCNQRFLGPAAVPMNCPSDEFFARSSLAHNQDSCVRGGNAGDLLAYFLDFGAISVDSVGPEEIADGGFEELILAD